jgi:hypothetical protein
VAAETCGRRADHYDNAVVESAFPTIKEQDLGPKAPATITTQGEYCSHLTRDSTSMSVCTRRLRTKPRASFRN